MFIKNKQNTILFPSSSISIVVFNSVKMISTVMSMKEFCDFGSSVLYRLNKGSSMFDDFPLLTHYCIQF